MYLNVGIKSNSNDVSLRNKKARLKATITNINPLTAKYYVRGISARLNGLRN